MNVCQFSFFCALIMYSWTNKVFCCFYKFTLLQYSWKWTEKVENTAYLIIRFLFINLVGETIPLSHTHVIQNSFRIIIHPQTSYLPFVQLRSLSFQLVNKRFSQTKEVQNQTVFQSTYFQLKKYTYLYIYAYIHTYMYICIRMSKMFILIILIILNDSNSSGYCFLILKNSCLMWLFSCSNIWFNPFFCTDLTIRNPDLNLGCWST